MMCIKQHLRAFLVHWVTFWVSLGPFRVTQPNAPPPGHLDEAHDIHAREAPADAG
jgi:hypothetical protein